MNNAPSSRREKKRTPFLLLVIIFLSVVLTLSFLGMLAVKLYGGSVVPLSVGSTVPDFTFTSFDGKTTAIKDLRGKTVVINFWASWCDNCANETGYLEEAWQKVKNKDQVVFIGVDYSDTQPAAQAFITRYGMDYLTGPDLGSSISQKFHVTGVPETYLIGSDGILKAVQIGSFSSTEQVLSFIGQ